MEAQLLTDAKHPAVLRQDHGTDHTSRLLITPDGDEPTQNFGPQPAALEIILDQELDFGLPSIIHPI